MREMEAITIIEQLCSAYKECITYMESANEIFMVYLSKEPEMKQRWEEFYKSRRLINEVAVSELRGIVDRLQEKQIIEAEVLIR